MALRNPCFKDPKLVSFEGELVERERGRRRRRRNGDQAKIKQREVWNFDFWYGN